MNRIHRRSGRRRWLLLVFIVAILVGITPYLLSGMGRFLVADETPRAADAVVVLSTGIEIYPRWIEAARLYRGGYVRTLVINGDRKTEVLKQLEARGLRRAFPWDTDARTVLQFLGVPDKAIISVAAEDAFDTISEAEIVVTALARHGIRRTLITTSRYHTRRARRIWQDAGAGVLEQITMVAAQDDPFDPEAWWREPRQIRWVLAEYGGWMMYWWRKWFA